jgi:hypothetical protein
LLKVVFHASLSSSLVLLMVGSLVSGPSFIDRNPVCQVARACVSQGIGKATVGEHGGAKTTQLVQVLDADQGLMWTELVSGLLRFAMESAVGKQPGGSKGDNAHTGTGCG